jgi:hypothetical protein
MAKVKKLKKTGGLGPDYSFYCPGCRTEHFIWTKQTKFVKCISEFNGDVDKPTFLPSIMIRHGLNMICHSYITEGTIHFLGDCIHEFSGQSLPMEDIK